MTTKPLTRIRPKSCQRCAGDAYIDYQDEPEWRCLQCGRPVPFEAKRQALPIAACSVRFIRLNRMTGASRLVQGGMLWM